MSGNCRRRAWSARLAEFGSMTPCLHSPTQCRCNAHREIFMQLQLEFRQAGFRIPTKFRRNEDLLIFRAQTLSAKRIRSEVMPHRGGITRLQASCGMRVPPIGSIRREPVPPGIECFAAAVMSYSAKSGCIPYWLRLRASSTRGRQRSRDAAHGRVGSRAKGVPCEAGEALGVEPDLVERAAKVRPGSTRKRIGSRAFRRRTWTNGHRAAAESIRDANVST